jgi:uncharacterized membrane protein (DUF485 family)
MPMTESERHLRDLAAERLRIAQLLTAAMIAVYFGFILLIAFARPMLARPLVPGLSVGILLGSLVIVAAWILTWIYIRWTNRNYDERLRNLQR